MNNLTSNLKASSSCDGTVRVWSVNSGNIVNEWDVLPKSNSFENSATICRLDFHPWGKVLAVPNGDSIKFYERESWTLSLTVTAPNSEVRKKKKESQCYCFRMDSYREGRKIKISSFIPTVLYTNFKLMN